MRFFIPIFAVIVALPLSAQEAAPAPTEELRSSVREWVETMRKIQEEENSWTKDNDVLRGYKEGLEKEIEDLKEEIERAKTRRDGGDKQSLDKLTERNLYAGAQEDLARQLRLLEEALAAKLPLFPAPLREMPKVSLAIETLQNSLQLPPEKRTQDVSKRLYNATELLAEVEKFQQMVHVHTELRKDSEDREFKMQIVYFGLAMAYGVNEDGSFAVTGRPAADGWKFQENKELAAGIQELVKAATDEKHAAFNKLPLVIP